MSARLVAELSAPILAFAAAFIAFLLAYCFHDKRTTSHRRARMWSVVVMVAAFLIGLVVGVVTYHDKVRAAGILADLQTRAVNAESAEKVARADRKGLQDHVVGLQRSLDPFVNLAVHMFPRAEREEALGLLLGRVRELEKNVSVLEMDKRKLLEQQAVEAIKRRTPPQIDAHLDASSRES